MKNWSTEVIAAVKNDNPRTTLITMELNGAVVNLTTAGHDISYNGVDYQGSGLALEVESPKHQKELRVSNVTMNLTAVDQSLLALFLNNSQVGRRVTITEVVLDNEHQVIGAVLTARCFVDSLSVDDSMTDATIAVTLSNALADFDAVRGIRTTNASFRRFYPESMAFINAQDVGSEIKWGGK